MRFVYRTDFRSANVLADAIEEVIGFGKCEVTVGRDSTVSVLDDADHAVARSIAGKMFGPAVRDAGTPPVVHAAVLESAYLTLCGIRIDSLVGPDKCVSSAGWNFDNPVTCPGCRAAYRGEDEP
jgi:hypothetical protein